MAEGPQGAPGEPAGLFGRVLEWWALAGGFILLGVVLMTTWSAASSALFGKPLPGDFELTELLVAVAVFTFLPYCQSTGANVTADIFTAHAGPRAVAAFGVLASLLALGFSSLLAWRTWAGLLDYQRHVETTAILKIPIWSAYVPALASLLLLVLACLITLREHWRALRHP